MANNEASETFQGLLLRHRGRTRLTQRQLASRVGVSVGAVQDWEGGVNYPSAERLKTLIEVYLETGGLATGREASEAEALWAAALREAPRMRTPLDRAWVADLLARRVNTPQGEAGGRESTAMSAPNPVRHAVMRRQDWGDAPDVPAFHGRVYELAALHDWAIQERCRLVALLGMGGIGKTTLAARVAQDAAPYFELVYWRNLRNAPLLMEWLGPAIGFLSGQQQRVPEGESAALMLLLELLRERRCMLVLDNFETLIEPTRRETGYRDGYSGYGRLLHLVAESKHESCVVLTSREMPPDLGALVGGHAVTALELRGLSVADGHALLGDKRLSGDAIAWASLVERYAGNGLALKVVGQTIEQLFGGDIAGFLQHAGPGTMFGGIRRLLDSQVERLSQVEQDVLTRLAVEREPVRLADLAIEMGSSVGRARVIEAVETLRRRSLVEPGDRAATFTLQSIVLEYVTDRLVERVLTEIESGEPVLLMSHALVKAHAKDYVRRSQERLIGQPVVEQVVQARGSSAAAERSLLSLLRRWRGAAPSEQGYGPGNVVNLLRLLRGNLNGLDLAHLTVRQAYLQEVDAQDAGFAGSQLAETVFAQAFDSPYCIALNADATHVVAGTSRGTVCVWSVADQRLLLSIAAHVGQTWGVALSQDATLVASAGLDEAEAVKVWAIPSGRLLASMQGSGGAWGVALSADNQIVASGHIDHMVRLWDAYSGRLLRTLEGHSGTVHHVALSLDGRLVVSGSDDCTVIVWEALSGRLLRTLQGHTGGVEDVALSADGQVVASGSQDGTVKMWDASTGELLTTLVGHSAGVYGVSLTHNRRMLASAGLDGLVRLWEPSGGQLLATLQGHTAGVWAVALSRDGDLAASGSQDGTIKLWEPESGRLLTTLQGHTTQLWGVALSVDGQRLVSGTQDGTVKVWDTDSGRLLRTLPGHASKVWGVALATDGKLLASASQDKTVKLWDAESGRLLKTLRGHTGPVRPVALSGDGLLLASGGYDGTVRLWDVKSGRPLATLLHQSTQVWGVALSGDGKLLASGGDDGLVRLWDAQTGQLLTTVSGEGIPVWGVALTVDGRRIAIGHVNGSLELWDVEQGRVLANMVGHSGGVMGLSLSTDGELLISGSLDQTVRLWDTRSGELRLTMTGHSGPVWGVALSMARRLMASASEDGTVKLWEMGTGDCVRTVQAERRYERMDITSVTGITDAQRNSLIALGAVDRTYGLNALEVTGFVTPDPTVR